MAGGSIENRIADRQGGAKDNLNALFKAKSNSSTRNLAAEDPALLQYTTLKADVRALLTYYLDRITEDSQFGAPAEATKMTNWLVDFETKYNLDDGISDVDSVPADKLQELSVHKDRAVLKLISYMRSSIGHEYHQMERTLPENISHCSRELPDLFHFVQTIHFLVKRCSSIELSMAAEGGADILQEKERVLASMRIKNTERESQMMDLKQMLVAGESDNGRFHMLNRQNDKIKALENQLVSERESIEELKSELLLQKQAKGMAQDQAIVLRSQIKSLRSNYDKDVAKLRPRLEEQVSQAKDDALEVANLRNSSVMNTSRIATLMKQVADLKENLFQSKQREKVAFAQAAEAHEGSLEAQSESAKLMRMQNVVVSAKMKFHELSRTHEITIKAKDEEIERQKQESLLFQQQKQSAEDVVGGLQLQVKQKVDELEAMHDQIMRWKAEAASEHLATKSMRTDLEIIQHSETAEFRLEFLKLQDELANSKELNEKLDKQLRVAMSRVYELQGQLLGDSGSQSVASHSARGDEKDDFDENDNASISSRK